MTKFRDIFGRGAERALELGKEAMEPLAQVKTAAALSRSEPTPEIDPQELTKIAHNIIDTDPERSHAVRVVMASFSAGTLSVEQTYRRVVGPESEQINLPN